MWRWSGRGWTVMPWAPASRHSRAALTTLGRPWVRVLRRVATLLTLTLSRVIASSPRVAFPPCPWYSQHPPAARRLPDGQYSDRDRRDRRLHAAVPLAAADAQVAAAAVPRRPLLAQGRLHRDGRRRAEAGPPRGAGAGLLVHVAAHRRGAGRGQVARRQRRDRPRPQQREGGAHRPALLPRAEADPADRRPPRHRPQQGDGDRRPH